MPNRLRVVWVEIDEVAVGEFKDCGKGNIPAAYTGETADLIKRLYSKTFRKEHFRMITEFLTLNANAEKRRWMSLEVYVAGMMHNRAIFGKTGLRLDLATFVNDLIHLRENGIIETKGSYFCLDNITFEEKYSARLVHVKSLKEDPPAFMRIAKDYVAKKDYLPQIAWLIRNGKIAVKEHETNVTFNYHDFYGAYPEFESRSPKKEYKLKHIQLKDLTDMFPG